MLTSVIAAIFALTLSPDNVEVLAAAHRSPTTDVAVQELTNFLSRVFGTPVPLVGAPTAGRRQIVVGTNAWSAAEGLDPSALGKDDAFIIKATPERVYLCGIDDYEYQFKAIVDRGRGSGFLRGRRSSLFAVYEFLERYADCRFYWPGELGEIVPHADAIEIPSGERVHAPDLVIRKYYHPRYGDESPWKDNGWIEDNEYDEAKGMTLSWLRLRMGSFNIPCCHGQNAFRYVERFGKSHPEYFLKKKDGSRFNNANARGCSALGQICYSSGAMEELYQDVKAYLTGRPPASRGLKAWGYNCVGGKYVDIMANDAFFRCECGKCGPRYSQTDNENYASEMVWGEVSKIANRLMAEGVRGYVTQMAYYPYRRVPDLDIPTNVMVMVAKTGPFSVRKKDRLREENAELHRWKEKVGNVWIWTYPNKYGNLAVVGVPPMTPHAWGDYYKMVAPDIFGAFAESECDRFFFNHLNYYVFSRVCWDVGTDVNAVIDEYFSRCYGRAAPEAKRFCEELEDRFLGRVVGAYVSTPTGPMAKAPSPHEIWTEIYSPAQLDAWGGLLDRGAAKLAKGSVEARRFKLFRDELLGVMRRTSDDYLGKTDAVRNAKRYREAFPRRNLVDRGGKWYAAVSDEEEKIVSESSIRVVSTNGNASALYYLDGSNGETLKPNARYRISFFVKGRDIVPTTANGGAGITLCDAFNNPYPKPSGLTGTFDWVHQTFEHRTAPRTGIDCRSYIYLRLTRANGTAWFDGITIEELPDQVVRPGACAVIAGRKASPAVRAAADELSKFLSLRFSGRKVPVRTAPRSGEFAFVVGDGKQCQAAGADPGKVPQGGFTIRTSPGRVCICGDDSVIGIAVRDFLERAADCRFFFADELGEIVRTGEDLALQELDIAIAPPAVTPRCQGGFSHHLGDYIRRKTAWTPGVREDILRTDYLNRMFGTSVVQWHMGNLIRKFEADRKEGREKVLRPETLSGYDACLTAARKAAVKIGEPAIVARIDLYRTKLYEPLERAAQKGKK